MKKAILFVVMLSLAAFVSVSIAADAPKAATTAPKAATTTSATVKIDKFGGSIKSVDAMAKTFVVSHKKNDMTFVVDDKTKITKAKKDMTFADLKAGLKVHVEYKMEMDKATAVAVMISTK